MVWYSHLFKNFSQLVVFHRVKGFGIVNNDTYISIYICGVPGASAIKNLPVIQETCRRHKRLRFESWVRKTLWSKKWQLTPVFSPGESHGQISLAGYSPWGHKELDTTEEAICEP